MKPNLKRDRGSWLAEVPGFRAWDSTPWKAWFRLRCLIARRPNPFYSRPQANPGGATVEGWLP